MGTFDLEFTLTKSWLSISKKSGKIAFFFEFFQIKMLLFSGLSVDRGKLVCNF